MTAPAHKTPAPLWQNYAFASLAPMGAVCFSNPIEVAKTRLQLQGELAKKSAAPRVYNNVFHCMYRVALDEGVRGVQRGLSAAIAREGAMNLFKIGLFEPILHFYHSDPDTPVPFWKRFAAAATSGACAGVATNPFDLLKTRMQALSTGAVKVGHQHHYKNVVDGFITMFRDEGIRGMWKGGLTSMFRLITSSSVQLSTYSATRDYVLKNKIMDDNVYAHVSCSAFSACVAVNFTNPIDVVRTRLYNQAYDAEGRGMTYRGPVDCIVKIARTEGFFGFYKGAFAHLLRLGPHMVLTFTFLEQLKLFAARQRERAALAAQTTTSIASK